MKEIFFMFYIAVKFWNSIENDKNEFAFNYLKLTDMMKKILVTYNNFNINEN